MNEWEWRKYFMARRIWRLGPESITPLAKITWAAWFKKKYGEDWYEYKQRAEREGLKSEAFRYRDALAVAKGDPSKVVGFED